ncbi:hypothetical protein AgCh_022056 [Apium graveolens]
MMNEKRREAFWLLPAPEHQKPSVKLEKPSKIQKMDVASGSSRVEKKKKRKSNTEIRSASRSKSLKIEEPTKVLDDALYEKRPSIHPSNGTNAFEGYGDNEDIIGDMPLSLLGLPPCSNVPNTILLVDFDHLVLDWSSFLDCPILLDGPAGQRTMHHRRTTEDTHANSWLKHVQVNTQPSSTNNNAEDSSKG